MVNTEDKGGWRLAVLQNDIKPIAQTIVTNGEDELLNKIGLNDACEVQQMIDALEEATDAWEAIES